VADGLFLGPGNPIKVRGDRPADAAMVASIPQALGFAALILGGEEEGRGGLERFS
jgi:hypothetical protein